MIHRGLDHTIDHYEKLIQKYELSDIPYLKSMVGLLRKTLTGLYKIRG